MNTETRQHNAALYTAHTPAGTKFTIWHGPKSKAKGRRVTAWTPEQLAEIIPENGAAAIYASFGHVNGLEGFKRTLFVKAVGRIEAIDKAGNCTYAIPYGAGRTASVLVK